MRFQNGRFGASTQSIERLSREIAAFANTKGGVIGIAGEDADLIAEIWARVVSGIRPDVSSLARFVSESDGSARIEVSEGDRKPYYLKAKGMRPIGVFVRAGDEAVCAGPRQIEEMLRDAGGDVYEERRSLNQTLTFSQARLAFARNHMELGPERYCELGIVDPEDGEFTNLGALLSDQCEHSVRINVFGGEAHPERKDSAEAAGSVCRQYDEAAAFLTSRSGEGGARPYPEEAIREALLNAIVHRDYEFKGSILINIYDEEIEFISAGGLVSDLTVEDIRSGVSEARNRGLARIFRRMSTTGASSSGVRRVFMIYQGEPRGPEIQVTDNSFRFTLPRPGTPRSGKKEARFRPARGPMSRQERQDDMIMQEIQQMAQRQAARRMQSGPVRVSGKGGMISYLKRGV